MNAPKHTPGPCPFCGGEAKHIPSASGRHHVECQAVGCAAHLYAYSEQKAIDAWNRRVPVEAVNSYASLRAANAAMEKGLRAALTAFSEMHHARTNPDWFTRGKEAADAHWFTWERKGIDAVKSAIERAALAQKEST